MSHLFGTKFNPVTFSRRNAILSWIIIILCVFEISWVIFLLYKLFTEGSLKKLDDFFGLGINFEWDSKFIFIIPLIGIYLSLKGLKEEP